MKFPIKNVPLSQKDLQDYSGSEQPINKPMEQERIIMSYLLSNDPRDHEEIDRIHSDPELQPEVRKLIEICRCKAETIKRQKSYPSNSIPASARFRLATADL